MFSSLDGKCAASFHIFRMGTMKKSNFLSIRAWEFGTRLAWDFDFIKVKIVCKHPQIQ